MDFQQCLIDSINSMEKAIQKKNYGFYNVLANRLATDSVLLENSHFVLFSMMNKDLYDNIREIDLNLNSEENIIPIILKFVKNFKELIKSPPHNLSTLMYGYYYQSLKELYKLHNVDEELNYNENPEFSKFAIHKIIVQMTKDIDIRKLKSRTYFIGLQNEMGRLFKNFGFNIEEIIFYSYISTLNRILDYIIYDFSENQQDNKDDENEQKYIEIVNRIIGFFNLYMKNEENFINDIKIEIFNISMKWRFFYLKYLEFIPRYIKTGKKSLQDFQMPEEEKEKLDEIVSKSIFKEKTKKWQ